MSSGISWNCGLRIVDLSEVAKQMQCKECSSLLDLKSTRREDRMGLASILFISCRCGVLNEVHTSGYVKTEMGRVVYSLNAQLASSLLQLEMEPLKAHQLLSSLSIPTPHLPPLKPGNVNMNTNLSPRSVPQQGNVDLNTNLSPPSVPQQGNVDMNTDLSSPSVPWQHNVDMNNDLPTSSLVPHQSLDEHAKSPGLSDSKGTLDGNQGSLGDNQGTLGGSQGTLDDSKRAPDEGTLDKHLSRCKDCSEARTMSVEKASKSNVLCVEGDLSDGEVKSETPSLEVPVCPLSKTLDTATEFPNAGDMDKGEDPAAGDQSKSVAQRNGDKLLSYKASSLQSSGQTVTKRSTKTVQSPLAAAGVSMKKVSPSSLAAASVRMNKVQFPPTAAGVSMKKVLRSSLAAAGASVNEVQSPLAAASVSMEQTCNQQKGRKRRAEPCQPHRAVQTSTDWPFQEFLAADGTEHADTAPEDILLTLKTFKLATMSRAGDAKDLSRKMCDVCGLSLSSCSALSRHRRLKHREGRPLLCPVAGCGKWFARAELLQSHVNCRHSETKPFQCFRCGKQFGTKKYMSDHLARCGQSPYKCQRCQQSFKDRAARRDHVAKRHEGQFFVCHCGKVYEWRTSLAKHQKKCLTSLAPTALFAN